MTDLVEKLEYTDCPNKDCPFDNALADDAGTEIERLQAKIKIANTRERKAFIAGANAVINDVDIEQVWQEYRSKDDSDWAVVKADNHSACKEQT